MYGKGAHSRNDGLLTIKFLHLGSLFHREVQNTRCGCELQYMEGSREFYTKCVFQILTICARIHLPGKHGLKERLYRIVLTSPEMCLDNSGFSVLLKDPQWSCSILFMVVNEAHHIEQWDTEFRRRYGTLDTLRSFLPRGAPVLAISATMPPTTLEHARTTLGMNAGKMFHLDLGNDRHNIVPLVWPMEGGAPNLAALDFVVRGRDRPLRTIIYFNNLLAMRACIYLRKILPPKQTHKIDVFHANRGPRTKKAVMKDFRAGKILVLCAMEIVGMVRTSM